MIIFFNFPEGQEIGPHSYLVICENIDAFHLHYPEMSKRIGNMPFNLSNEGEVIRLYAPGEQLVDSVHYDNEAPWPEAAAGTGASLQLIDPGLNNDVPENWTAQPNQSSPGKAYEGEQPGFASSELGSVYPNPTDFIASIPYTLKEAGWVEINLLDLTGRSVLSLVNEWQNARKHHTRFSVIALADGIYLYQLKINGIIVGTKRVVVNH